MKKIVLMLAVAPLLMSCVASDGPNTAAQNATSTAGYGNFCRFYGVRQCRLPEAKPKGSKCFCKGSFGPVQGGIVE